MEFDAYLSNRGAYEFLPFKDRETFEAYIRGKKKYVAILSGWHYLQIHKEYSFIPLMRGVRNGRTLQRRILVADNSTTVESVKTSQIASATSIQHTVNELRDMFRNWEDPSKILTVPRDIDALMSVGIGISKCALATESSFEKLNSIHPSLFKRLTTLAEGKPSWLLIFAANESYEGDAETIMKIFETAGASLSGKEKIKMLGLDGWEKIEGADRKKIEGSAK